MTTPREIILPDSAFRSKRLMKMAVDCYRNAPEEAPEVTPSVPPQPNTPELSVFAQNIYEQMYAAMLDENNRSRFNRLVQLGAIIAPYSTNVPFISYLSEIRMDIETREMVFPQKPATYHLPPVAK